MNKKQFKINLKRYNISFKEINGMICIFGYNVNLYPLTTLPPNTIFENRSDVDLYNLKELPPGIKFKNGGDVHLNRLTSLPPNTIFENGGNVDLSNLEELSPGIKFENGGDVHLNRLTSLPPNTIFENGGNVDLGYKTIKKEGTYLKRHNVKIKNNYVFLYKRVSNNYKTQEGKKNETTWTIGSTLEHPNWKPNINECGEGKFHACAKPNWCSYFRNKYTNDKFIKIKIYIKDLYEWINNPIYPQKIAFRKGIVVEEVKPLKE